MNGTEGRLHGASDKGSVSRLSAATIATCYAVFSLIYILTSDVVVAKLAPAPLEQVVQSAKGSAFVLFTSLGLFLAVRTSLRSRQEAEARFRILFEESPVGLVEVGPDQSVLAANRAARAVLGGAIAIRRPAPAWLAETSGGPLRIGEYGWVRVVTTERRADGSRVVAVEDVTDRQEADRQALRAERLDAAVQVVGGVAHEFNNLMTVIELVIESARRSQAAESDAKLARNLDIAQEAATRATHLTAKLTAYVERSPPRPCAVAVMDALGRLCERLRRDLPPGMAVRLDGPPSGLEVLAEPERLRAALDALAENAREALAAKGGGTIAVWARPLDGKLVALTVADDGPGMDKDLAARAAEPFFTTKKVGQGLGLGLTVAEIFARRMGGRLELVTAPGQGTHVTLVLPRA